MNAWNRTKQRWTRILCAIFTIMAAPAMALAASVTGVELNKTPAGDVVSIHGDAPLAYEVFDLTAPARLVIRFPKASLARGVEPLHKAGAGVTSVFPVAADGGVRVEVGMKKALKYRIEERGNDLIVRFAPGGAPGHAAAGAVLKDIDIRDVGASATELVVRGDHMDASHDAFVTNGGRTLILDFWGATSVLPKEHYAVATQKIRGVTVGQARGRVRLVVDLVKGGKESHQIKAGKNQLVVRVGGVAPGRKTGVARVEEVRFQPDDRIAHLIIRTDRPDPVVNVHAGKHRVVLDIKKAELAPGQERTLDVRDFPGPVRQVDVYHAGDKVRVVARLREESEVSSFQQGNVLTLTLTPRDVVAAKAGGTAGGETIPYHGQKVTLDFKDIDIRNALKLIADVSDLNIIMSDDVQGKLTMRLVDVPWDQALDLILTARGLGKERQGNVLRIAPVKVLADERKSRLEAMKNARELEPLVTEFITLGFAKAADVKKMIENSAGGGKGGAGKKGGQTSMGLLSPRGRIMMDKRTNTLIVKDTRESINNIKRLVARIDRPEKEVLIAARIVEATDNFTRDIGVRWGGGFTKKTPRMAGGGAQKAISPVTGLPLTTTGAQGFLVDLPATIGVGGLPGGALGLSVGYLGGQVNLALELSAAEANGLVKIVSSPRVVTTNLKKAVIQAGQDIPFATVSQNGTQVQFKKAALGLEVTPQITADQRVLLHVLVRKDTVTKATVGGNPIIATKTVDTNIVLGNGETVVIGGIYERTREKANNGIPGLMRIPLLGWLFKKDFRKDSKQELLIFLTPKILEGRPGRTAATAEAS